MIAALLVALGAAVAQSPVDLSEEGQVSSAVAAMSRGAYADAANQLSRLAEGGAGAHVRLLEAGARYELGDLRGAEIAVAASLAEDPSSGAAWALQGLVLADLGRGDEAMGALAQAEERASAGGDHGTVVRVWLHRGLVLADRGQHGPARDAWTTASEVAERHGLPELGRQARVEARALDDGGVDLVARATQALGQGRVGDAKRLQDRKPTTRRGWARAHLVRGMVHRVEGRLVDATNALVESLEEAEDAGLLREALAARVELGTTLALRDDLAAAESVLSVAAARVARTSWTVRALDVALARARVALGRGDAAAAADRLAEADVLAARMDTPPTPLLAEVRGHVARVSGQDADPVLADAEAAWAALDRPADAARVATARVRVAASTGGDPASRAQAAHAWFGTYADAAGPAHVALAWGLGLTDAGDVAGALVRFEQAARVAGEAGRPRLVAVAEANLGEALVALGLDAPDVLEASARHARLEAARARFADGQQAYEARLYGAASEAFDEARVALEELGRADDVEVVSKALVASRYHAALRGPDETAGAALEAVAAQAADLGLDELAVKASAHAALAHARTGRASRDDLARAGAAAADAELAVLAARCWLARATATDDVEAAAADARIALDLDPRDVGAWAAYEAAYAAYQQDRLGLARALVAEARRVAEGEAAAALTGLADALEP